MSEGLHPEQVKALRKMTPARRLELTGVLIEQARQLRAAMLRAKHPDWPDKAIAQALSEFVAHAHS